MDMQTIDKGFEKVWQLFQKTDRKFQETADQIKTTDLKINKLGGK